MDKTSVNSVDGAWDAVAPEFRAAMDYRPSDGNMYIGGADGEDDVE